MSEPSPLLQVQNPFGLPVPDCLSGGGWILPFQGFAPEIGADVFLAPTCSIIGRVNLGDRASVWFNTVLRGDINRIEVGEGSNIQDNSVLHVADDAACIVGKDVVVGHSAVLHACTIEDGCLIGMGAIVLNKAVVGRGSLVGAGSLVTQGTVVPPYSLVLGSPGKVIRPLTDKEREENAVFAPKYVRVAGEYRGMFKGESGLTP